jgi:serine/threonine-protein kinase RsbW
MSNTIRISCDLKNLQTVRNFVIKFLSPYALSEIVLNQIKLAVDEISANIIIHASKKDSNQYFTLKISPHQDGFIFEFTDKGSTFDPSLYSEPDIDRNKARGKQGGMGIKLVNLIMDKVEFSADSSGNTWRLFKKVLVSTTANQLIRN